MLTYTTTPGGEASNSASRTADPLQTPTSPRKTQTPVLEALAAPTQAKNRATTETRRERNRRYYLKRTGQTGGPLSDAELFDLVRPMTDRLWPVYSWDTSPGVFALRLTEDETYAAVATSLPEGTELSRAQFGKVLAEYRVARTSQESRRFLDAAIADFYGKRRDRKIRPSVLKIDGEA